MRVLLMAGCLLTLFSCSEEDAAKKNGSTAIHTSTASAAVLSSTKGSVALKGHRSKVIGGVQYSVSVMPATEFLRRKGEQVAEEDLEALAKETVLLLRMELMDVQKDIWNYKGMQFSEDDAVNYLVGQIASDISIEQDGKEWRSNGSSFEGRNGAVHVINVQLFFGEIHCDQPLSVKMYDQLFGAGLIKFGINE
jgi:hypothetical protein